MACMTAETITYAGADLYPKQRAAVYDETRISVIEGGTKSGKTVAVLAWLFEQAFEHGREGRNFWWIAPVFRQAEIGYRRSVTKLRPIARHCHFNQTTLTVTLPNDARIVFQSGEQPDNLYGEDVYACVMDEASRMREEAWHAIRSTLTKTRGPVRIIGNVKGRKNWFYTLARAAEAGADGMAFHRITSYDAVEAGVLDRDEIEGSRADFARLGREGVWRQLYLAEAADDGDNPFGLEAIRACVAPLSSKPALVAGVDLAGRGAVNLNPGGDALDRDYTAIVMLDRQGSATYLDRFRASHSDTETRIVERVGRTAALVDSTGTGDAIVERLQRRGDMRVEGYTFTERSRQDLLDHLGLMIGEEAVHFPDGTLRAELESFEFDYSRTGVRFVVPPGQHDDLAFALALAAKKLPWKRRVTPVPVGLPSAAGSAWTGAGGDDAWRKYQESLKPTTVGMGDDPSQAVGGPLIVAPSSGRSKWRDADR